MDSTDKAILKLLQEDATLSLDDIAIRIGASKTPIWNRIKRLRESGVISHQVAIVSPQAVGLDTCFCSGKNKRARFDLAVSISRCT